MTSYLRLCILLTLGIFALSWNSCSLLKGKPANQLVFQYEKTACFGECPVFDMEFYADGTVKLNARQFMDQLGRFEMKLPKKEIKDLTKALDEMNFCELDNLYGSNAMDFPSTFVRTTCNGEVKTVEAVMDIPEVLLNFLKTVDGLRKGGNWTPTGANESSS